MPHSARPIRANAYGATPQITMSDLPPYRRPEKPCGWCGYGFGAQDRFYGCCCVPCVYGAAYEMSTTGSQTGLCNASCVGIMCASCFLSPVIVVPIAGTCIRTQTTTTQTWGQKKEDPACSIFCHEVFNTCTCATCRMASYYADHRNKNVSGADFLLAD